jgi:hypothetical protein
VGLEPTTSWTTTRGYHQLSYGHRVRPRIPDRDPGPRYARGTVRILSVSLLAASADRERLRRFYGDELGLPPSTGGGGAAVFRVGTTTIEFSPTPTGRPFYHFAFRVPRNRFDAARAWLAGRTELLPDSETGDVTFEFASWNASACYAHDPCGNIVELIAHRELPEESAAGGRFDASELVGVCEIGVVGPDTRAMAAALAPLGIELWDGTLDAPGRLAFMGGRDGVLILSPAGRGWMPTGRPAEPHRVDAVVAGRASAEATFPGTEHRVRTRPSP